MTPQKITPTDIQAKIAKAEYLYHDRLTVCVLTLQNGYFVTGESACVDPANYNQALGEKYAYENAFAKVWSLEGYLLRERMSGQGAAVADTLIARLAHEANRAYCQSIGDNSQPAWDNAPQWQKDSALAGVEANRVGNPSAAENHLNWYAHKLAEGWKYGAFKDPVNKLHPCMVPYDQLPPEQQTKDALYRAVVRTALGKPV